ncbi:Retrovirus-related Pol polyprotein from transposon TNT 1-94 [Vitis vinifera]|uniref:Retrovirus-related Pol polyprotein from transposon TNT 1-94 n=1 Tax=Vitis vinifera TaxID=29760 RepID=A0A438JNU8_VITVI|nr:Retrovirus-related Pol polyprotein from transposon TNT 1-94 [Vitis vinifera]
MIQTQFQAKIQILKTDNAKEHFNSILNGYLLSHGIVHQSSCVNTPQQNGEAILTAAYLINRMPSRILDFQTPCQILLQSFPNTRLISTIPFKVFGCSTFVHVHQQHRDKLDPRALKCIFLGYSPTPSKPLYPLVLGSQPSLEA